MHPDILRQLAEDHVRSLVTDADAARLARSVAAPSPSLRRRVGLRLIAAGERLAPECPGNVIHLHGRV